MTLFETQLEELLKKEPTELVAAQKTLFAQLTAKTGERYILFGAGWLGQITLAGLREAGVEPLAFADNNPKLWGTMVTGLQVFPPPIAVQQFGDIAVFVITVYTSAPVWEQLNGLGLKIASFTELAWHYPRVFMPYYNVDYPYKIFAQAGNVRKALHLWADDTSRREYLGQLLWQTSIDPSVLPPHLPQNEIYFADDIFAPLAEEVFVDCGAFDGDSVQEFIKRRSGSFAQVIAVEPDPVNCRALEARIAALPAETGDRIRILQNAAGSKREVVIFDATGTVGSSIGSGSYQVQCAPLDELLSNVHPTFIKMDIEGAEIDALLGARNIIQQDKPVLAICTYHAQEHMWQAPLLIHSFSSDYDFFFRRYADECWELICYAVPKSRLR